MKRVQCLLLILITCLMAGIVMPNPVIAESGPVSHFPEDTIVVPMGTSISIDDEEGIVTIYDCPVDISEGDTFIVYLQDLPIGYDAVSVIENEGSMIISVQKADKSVYEFVEEEGIIELTPDMYEFIPANNVAYSIESPSNAKINIMDTLEYENGELKVKLAGEDDFSIQVGLSNLRLSHSFSNGNVSLALSGQWNIHFKGENDSLVDRPLGEIRVWGVGKIALSLNVGVSAEGSFSGSFSVGFDSSGEGDGKLTRSFGVNNATVADELKAEIDGALKIQAGVDILVAEADLYFEVGIKTEVSMKNTTHYDYDPPRTVYCNDLKVYAFASIGAEARYINASGKKVKVASVEFELMNEDNSVYMRDIHYENNVRVGACSEGMDTTSKSRYGGVATDFGSTLFSGSRERILETSVDLPWDIETDRDFYLANGNLNLNGHTLTINGNLIQSGGTLTIGNGTLIVHGDYRIQSYDNGEYGASSGSLNMTNYNGSAKIDGDFIIQTSSGSNKIQYGTIMLNGGLYQKNTIENSKNFISGTALEIIMTSEKAHIIKFEDYANNSIGHLTLENTTTVQSGISIGVMDNNGFDLTVNGPLTATGKIALNDNDSVAETTDYALTVNGDMFLYGDVDLNGGILTVSGSLYHRGGRIHFNRGKVNITDGYYSVGEKSVLEPGREYYTDSSGSLRMVNAADEMRVGGDMLIKLSGSNQLTAGTLYIGGNFTQLNGQMSGNFSTLVDHKTILNGTREQIISFADSTQGFGTLESTNDQLIFENNINWLIQTSDIHAVSRGATLRTTSRTVDMNSKKLTIDGDLKVQATIDVNGGELKINGSLYYYFGMLNINGGKVNITDNYYSVGESSVFEPGKEYYTDSSGSLKMVKATDEMRVGGDMLIKLSGSNQLTAGTLYIGGNFTQLNGQMSGNFHAGKDHRTVLTGTREQVISFADSLAGFGTLESLNDQLVFKNNVHWIVQNSDIHATAKNAGLNSTYHPINMNGKTLTIDGDLTIKSSIDVNGGGLYINGSVHHYNGTLNINGGKVNITGNYYSIGEGSVLEQGKEDITESSGYLRMIYTSDEMRIGGDVLIKTSSSNNWLTAGTLYVAGDFRCICGRLTSSGFVPGENHKTVLNGTGFKSVVFESGVYNRFGTLEITQPLEMYTFAPDNCWITLIQPEIPVFGTPDFILPAALREVEESAFEGIAANIVYIPDTCVSIGAYAFQNAGITQIRVPAGCFIADTAFDGCENVLVFGARDSTAEEYCNTHSNCTFIAE